MESIFPKDMMKNEVSLDTMVSRLTYFQESVHMIHWRTSSYAEHKATGSFYEYLQSFRDELIEKVMGYTGKKPSPYKLDISCNKDCASVLAEIQQFTSALKNFGEMNGYHDVCNLADSLSGETAKTKYLLSLS